VQAQQVFCTADPAFKPFLLFRPFGESITYMLSTLLHGSIPTSSTIFDSCIRCASTGLGAICADGLVTGRRFAAQLVSEFNQPKIQVALARAHKFKTGKAVRFA
jgi:hypothetical protein